MSNNRPTALILGGTGRTGSLLAGKLARQGIAGFPEGIEKVTGRPSTSFRAFAERNASAWTLEGK
jgi:hypothetical protein